MKIEGPLIIDGKRLDGRKPEEIREIRMKVSLVENANGSAMVSFGRTTALAAVYGPREIHPKHLQDPERGILRVRYMMLPFSVDERKSPGMDRRSIELSKIIRTALEPAIFLEEFPRVGVDIFVDILQADGSTRVTSINAASLALASAGVPMKDLVCACSIGKVDNVLVLDINGIEDNNCQADLSFAMMPGKDKITLIQMDGLMTKEELMKAIELGRKT